MSDEEFVRKFLTLRQDTSPLRVIVLGGYGGGNLGDECILSVILELIKYVRQDASIYVPSRRNPNLIRSIHGVDSGLLFSFKTFIKFLKAQVIIIGAGDLFSREISFPAKFLPLVAIISKILLRQKVAYLSIGFYHDTSLPVRIMVLTSMMFVDAISVRDQVSLEHIRPILHRRSISLIPYLPMNLKPIKRSLAQILLRRENVNLDKFLVGLSLRYFHNTSLNNEVESKFADVIDTVLEKSIVQFIFIPFTVTTYSFGNMQADQVLAKVLYERLKHKEGFVTLKGEYKPEYLKGLIGSMDLLVGMRVIPLVLAYSMKIPCIAVSCLEKISSFACMVGLTSIRLEELNADALTHIINLLKSRKKKQ